MRQLFDAARKNNVDLAFEASVAASIPLIRILKGYRGESISRISGILNGTSNYILSQMGHGLDFESALSRAIDYGYAEADHLLDTSGYDARDKLAIIASLVYDTEIRPEEIYCEGINSITPVDLDFAAKHGVEEGGSGYSIKSLATAETTDGRLALHVYPALISKTHPLSSVQNELNAIYLHGDLSGPQLFQGRGAGREATNSAVVSDIIRLAENRRRGIVEALPSLNSKVITVGVDSLKRKGYVRINLRHVPGSIANASRIMADHGFNIEDSIQRRRFQFRVNEETVIPDIVTVEPLPYRTVQNALKELGESDSIDGKPFFLRFEE
jgi:homoserine dehydrogenase